MPQYRTIQIPIEEVETGMTVLFPMPDGKEEVPFRVRSKKLSFGEQGQSVTLTSLMEDSGGTWTITESPGFLLWRVIGTIDD